jgi:hypothetical protein
VRQIHQLHRDPALVLPVGRLHPLQLREQRAGQDRQYRHPHQHDRSQLHRHLQQQRRDHRVGQHRAHARAGDRQDVRDHRNVAVANRYHVTGVHPGRQRRA